MIVVNQMVKCRHSRPSRAAAILLGALAILAGIALWHAPRCTGPTQADICPLAGSRSG